MSDAEYHGDMASNGQRGPGDGPAPLSTRERVLRLLNEYPEETSLLRAACEQARRCAPGDFAGSWVLRELSRLTGRPSWRPGLRRLSAFGLIEKTGITRGGRRAYYRMPDREEVERALTAIEARETAASTR
jgi:hypothetical protein